MPLKLLCEKYRSTRFEPSGFTGNPEVPRATSIMDYIFRWLDLKFLKPREAAAIMAGMAGANAIDGRQLDLPAVPVMPAGTGAPALLVEAPGDRAWIQETDAPTCHECGAIMVRSGACHKCLNCGATSGCS